MIKIMHSRLTHSIMCLRLKCSFQFAHQFLMVKERLSLLIGMIILQLSLLFDQMKRQKSYNLACTNSSQNSPRRLFTMPQNESAPNIFRGTVPDRGRGVDLRSLRKYDYVGGKQISAYYERARKTSKDKRRETWLFNLPGAVPRMSKASIASGAAKEPQKLSGQQILSKVHHRLETFNSTIQDCSFNCSRTGGNTSNTFHHTSQGEAKSLHKKLIKHREYTRHWDDLREYEKKKGFPSVMTRLEKDRNQIKDKERKELSFMKENINERSWEVVLHKKVELRSIYDQKLQNLPKRQCTTMGLSGKSKLKTESAWVERQGEKGYSFKMMEDS